MERQLAMTDNGLKYVVMACEAYVNECVANGEDEADIMAYKADLEAHRGDWGIADTGVFHDAIGKPIKCNGLYLWTEDDY